MKRPQNVLESFRTMNSTGLGNDTSVDTNPGDNYSSDWAFLGMLPLITLPIIGGILFYFLYLQPKWEEWRRRIVNAVAELKVYEAQHERSKKEVETLWFMHEGRSRDPSVFLRSKDKDGNPMKVGKLDRIWEVELAPLRHHFKKKRWDKEPVFYFELIPPEVVEHVACFVEGKAQRTNQV